MTSTESVVPTTLFLKAMFFFVYATLLKIVISMLIAMIEMVTFIVSVLLVLRVMVRFAMISMSV